MSSLTRRAFTTSLAAAPLIRSQAVPRPNILWITCEDIGPHLHACGDDYSVTPNLDRLCGRGMIYMNAWSNAPVCAPARTTIISGMYPPSTGSEHMRSETRLPGGFQMFPGYLREAGYYCSNNAKEDYNLAKPPGTWDESSKQAHWRKRASGQPFFSVFNHEITHESQIRTRPHQWVHDPAKARVPAYHPDTLEVRQDWAQYYDNITTMDGQAGKLIDDLAKDGLADDTIVVFFGDHGSGMPRSKRWPYNSGLNVSIVVSFPEKFRHLAPKDYRVGTKSNRLVGFVDLAPSMLSLAGVQAPSFYQGAAFLGPYEATPRTHSFGFRGRMDERIDCVRTVRNQRYVYVRNYMPHKIYGQHLDYMWQTPTTRVWERLYKEGKLNAAQRKFWEPKPAEELYDLQSDRDEVNNLADSAAHRTVIDELRKAHHEHVLAIRDVGLLPEAEIHSRAGSGAPYDAGHDPKKYPIERVLAAADLASSRRPGVTAKLVEAMSDPDSAVRYWGAMGVLIRGESEFQAARAAVVKLATDPAPCPRIVAAELLGRFGTPEELKRSLDTLIAVADPAANGIPLAIQALNSIDALGRKAMPLKDRIDKLPKPKAGESNRITEYTARLRETILETLG
jgi:arylsulfatase A-like enzyme